MKSLPPLIFLEAYYSDIERDINELFQRMIYAPLREVLLENLIEVQNAGSPLADAIAAGRVYYDAGTFTGTFSAAISKELRSMGAKYNARSQSWVLAGAPPAAVQIAAAQAQAVASRTVSSLITALDAINVKKMVKDADFPAKYAKPIGKINEDFTRLTRSIAIAPKLTDEAKEIIARQWGENLELYIKDWSDSAILSLRQKVAANAMRGQRAGNLVKTIQDSYDSSKKKAKFLARQETSLLMSKMREQRYSDIGITRYTWSTSGDEKVRSTHKRLNGKVYSWNSPPVVDDDGNRANPGEDFGCRCIAVPLMEKIA